MAEKVIFCTKSFPFERRLWLNHEGSTPHNSDVINSKMQIFKKKNILNLIKRAADFTIFNISYRYYYYNKKTL